MADIERDVVVRIGGTEIVLQSDEMVGGDMPGDRIVVQQSHADRAAAAYPRVHAVVAERRAVGARTVVSVFGGSGVGKSEIATVLGTLLSRDGHSAYVLSGDNYPRRVPVSNDGERLRVYRTAAIQAIAIDPAVDADALRAIRELWPAGTDSDPTAVAAIPGGAGYYRAGRDALADYLGSHREIDFDDINRVIRDFRAGADEIALKRMGRTPEDLWYERVAFGGVDVLIVEWTHGNSRLINGVDFPVYLESTPEYTLEHRRKRARDKGVDSPFTTLVLEIEQESLAARRESAACIVTLDAEIVS